MTQGQSAKANAATTEKTPAEMLDWVYRELVQIHAAMAERTTDDVTIIPWTRRELKTIVDEMGAFRRQQREQKPTKA